MADPALLEGVATRTVDTSRLRTRLLSGGAEGGAPIFFVHGNASSSRFFEETLAALPAEAGYRGLAPDLRGFGGSKTKPVDTTRGLADSLLTYCRARPQGFPWSMSSLLWRVATEERRIDVRLEAG